MDRPCPGTALRAEPLTPERWGDFLRLFGERGACGGCWCMYWRLEPRDFERGKGRAHREAMEARVRSGEVPGLLAFAGDEPAGWISLGPRGSFPRLERSRVLRPVDGRPVWSVVCFFVAKGHRKRGVAAFLLAAAVRYARSRGAEILEGYPQENPKGLLPAPFLYTGVRSLFEAAGFRVAARRSPRRPVMRLELSRDFK